MLKPLMTIAAAALLGACGYVSEYEKAVYDYEPAYCYRSLAGVQCYKSPNHRDERRLVNYFGPHPSRYERPEPLPPPRLLPPPPVDFYVRDAEPIPSPAVPMKAPALPSPEPLPEASVAVEAKSAAAAPVGRGDDVSGEAVSAARGDAAAAMTAVPATPPAPSPVPAQGI